tara:strand:- start:57 stop:1022 length:966 start_codon:yes stop_codon:yes gene_type:complete
MGMMEFSVVIPTYNREGLIGRCLDSIISQAHEPSEIVVVDDGSIDATERLITRHYGGIKYLKIENSGPLLARKTGIEHTTAPWIALCDSDDVWHPNHLQRRCALIDRFPASNFTFSNFVLRTGPTRKHKFDQVGPDYFETYAPKMDAECVLFEDAYLALLETQIAFPSTIAFTRSLYEKIGGLDGRFSRLTSEDAHFTRKCALQGIVACDRTATVTIHRTPNSVSHNNLANNEGNIEILRNIMESCNLAENQLRATIREINRISSDSYRGGVGLALRGRLGRSDRFRVRQFWASTSASDRTIKDYVKFALFRTVASFWGRN